MFGHGDSHGHRVICMLPVLSTEIFNPFYSFVVCCPGIKLLTNSLFSSKKISTPVRVQGLEQVSMIAVGAFHNLALSEDGILWAWGNNEYGQLGIGDTQPRSQPIRVEGLSDLSLVSNVLLLLISNILSKQSFKLVGCMLKAFTK